MAVDKPLPLVQQQILPFKEYLVVDKILLLVERSVLSFPTVCATVDKTLLLVQQSILPLAYRLVQIERQKLCPREFLTPFFRVRPRNFAHIFWKAVPKTRRGGFFNFLSRWPVIRGPGWST